MTDKAHRIFDFIIEKRYVFAMIFFSVSFSTFSFLYLVGLIPEEFTVARAGAAAQESDPELEAVVRESASSQNRVDASLPEGVREELPVRVSIGDVGIDSAVVNPGSTDIRALDEELKKGVVRYPTSGKLGEGNMLLFGHSTSIKVVNNQAFKAFNDLGKVNVGDEITVESDRATYVYKVFSVRLTTTEDALIKFDTGRNMLTLSTCNTFGAKEERFVVEADFVKKVPKRVVR